MHPVVENPRHIVHMYNAEQTRFLGIQDSGCGHDGILELIGEGLVQERGFELVELPENVVSVRENLFEHGVVKFEAQWDVVLARADAQGKGMALRWEMSGR